PTVSRPAVRVGRRAVQPHLYRGRPRRHDPLRGFAADAVVPRAALGPAVTGPGGVHGPTPRAMTTPAAPAGSKPKRFAALAHRNYRLLWTGLIVSNVGTWMQLVSQSWLIHHMTGRATDLVILGLTRALPLLLLSLVRV